MSDEQSTPQTEKTQPGPSSAAWQEVGQQFQMLGQSLAAAFRATWQDENNRQRMKEMQSGLESMIDEIGQAIQSGVKSPEAQKARSEASKTFETVRAASEQTVQEMRPHLVAALRQVNEELQRLIGHMEQTEAEQKAEQKPVTEGKETQPPVTDAAP